MIKDFLGNSLIIEDRDLPIIADNIEILTKIGNRLINEPHVKQVFIGIRDEYEGGIIRYPPPPNLVRFIIKLVHPTYKRSCFSRNYISIDIITDTTADVVKIIYDNVYESMMYLAEPPKIIGAVFSS